MSVFVRLLFYIYMTADTVDYGSLVN